MKKAVKIALSSLLVLCVAAVGIGVHLGYAKTTDEDKTYEVDTKGEALKVAIISDMQLPNTTDKTTHQYESFEKTLTMLKEKGMDALIIAGDFTDLATKNAWGTYKEIYDKVMGDENPIPLYIMGNHDYWLEYFLQAKEIATPAKLQKRFTKYTGEYPFSHKVINGYHFICWSSSNGSYDTSYQNKEWIKAELDKAVAANDQNPIFVITHLNPGNTAYGSDEWGNSDIYDVLKDYKQVVSLSGHSHYSLIDERSIWQDEFTAFTTQSLDYIELESGKFNGSIPKDAYGNSIADDLPACLYMEITDEAITINRLENNGSELKEPWVIEAPFGSEESLSKYSNSQREAANIAPVIADNPNAIVKTIKDIDGIDRNILTFTAGRDDDFVHSYKVEFLDESEQLLEFEQCSYDGEILKFNDNGDVVKEEDTENYKNAKTKSIDNLLYFSDFAAGLENMSDTVELRLPETMPKQAKYVRITAIDSWNAQSAGVICPIF